LGTWTIWPSSHCAATAPKSVKRWLHRKWKAKRTGVNLQVGDLVLELVDPPPGAFHHNVIGPFKIGGFTNEHRTNAILQTGSTDFRDAQRYVRPVRRLAKYYTASALQRQQPDTAAA
jgi:hypothetical protein